MKFKSPRSFLSFLKSIFVFMFTLIGLTGLNKYDTGSIKLVSIKVWGNQDHHRWKFMMGLFSWAVQLL